MSFQKRFTSSIPLFQFLLLLGMLFISAFSTAQEADEGVKMILSEAKGADNFGKSVSVFGDFAIVGAWTADEQGPESGAAFIYQRDAKDNWTFQQKVIASDGAAFHNFGTTVLINNNTIAISAPGNDDFAGAVYLYEMSEEGAWVEITKLMAHDRSDADYFGSSISMSNDKLIIGAYGDDDLGKNAGAAYLFAKDPNSGAWKERQKLHNPEGTAGDKFGLSVAIDADQVVVGAENDNRKGSITFFTKESNKWKSYLQVFASDGEHKDRFGHSLSLSGEFLAVGADRVDGSTGAVYLFQQNYGGSNNWGELKKISPVDGDVNDRFGRKVAISDDFLLIGSEGHELGAGAAYLFRKDKGGHNNWGMANKMMAYDKAPKDLFGSSVSIYKEDIFIGAYQKDELEMGAGSLYQYKAQDRSIFAAKEKSRD